MLRELLLRDLTMHRRVWLTATAMPALFMATIALSPGVNFEGLALHMWVFGLLLLALLPVSLHIREGMLGTLCDLLSLPVQRRDIVRLRYLEGLLACLAFTALYLLFWIPLHHPPRALVWEMFRSPVLLWVLCIFMAYPLPFALRWGGQGVVAAYLIFMMGATLWTLLTVYGSGLPLLAWLPKGFDWIARHLHSGGALLAFGAPLVLLAGFYRLSLWALERVDA